MKKLCILVAVTILSSAGWWIGAHVGVMTAFLISSIGSFAGVYLGWRIHRDYLS